MSGSVIVIRYDGTNITPFVLFESASFESQLNAVPGTFEITVKDVDQTMSFVTGKEVTLEVDGQLIYGGFLTMVSRKFAIPVDDTSAASGGPGAVKTRQWVLRGVDYNILFDKRVLRNTSNYLRQIPSFAGDRKDGDLIRNDLCDQWLDIPSGFNTTTYVDDVVCPFTASDDPTETSCDPDRTGAWLQQGTVWRKQMEDFAQFSGAVWYLDAEKNLHWHALEDTESRWGFSDVPNKRTVTAATGYQGATYGFRELDATEDGSLIVNDALVWGGSEVAGTSGGVVFARRQNADSIATHNRWQLAERHFGEGGYGIQSGVNVRASVIVNGQPGSVAGDTNRGLKYPQWQFRFAWFAHDVPTISGTRTHIVPGNIVPIILYTFGTATNPLIQSLPLRQVRITFPELDPDGNGYVRFDGFFGLQVSDPWTLWRYLLKNRNRIDQVQSSVATVDNNSDSCVYGAFGNFYPIEATNGSRTTFTIPFGYIGGTTTVFINGILQRQGADYSESDPTAGEITFFSAPLATDWIWIQCRCLEG